MLQTFIGTLLALIIIGTLASTILTIHILNTKLKVESEYFFLIKFKSLEGTECPTVDIEIYNKRRKEIVAKQ